MHRLNKVNILCTSADFPRSLSLAIPSDFWRSVCTRGLQVSRGVLQILECDPLFCGQTAEENGRLRQIYAKHWQTKLKLNKYRNIVCQLKHLEDLAPPAPSQDQ